MSRGGRIGLVVGTVAALVLGFVLLSPGDDDSRTASTPAAPAPAATGGARATTSTQPASGYSPEPTTSVPAPTPAPTFTTIVVRAGKPAGGVKTITVTKGDRARIAVSSPDTTDEIHLHGYDLKRDLKAGGSVRFSFEADAEGIFEIELEGAGAQIGRLVVEP